jgi:hypothetical protein
MKLSIFLFVTCLILATCGPAAPAAPTPVPSADQLIKTLEAASLEVTEVQPLEDLSSMEGAVEGLKFYTPSLCDGCSSVVLIFDSEASALTMKGFIEQAGKANEAFKFHLYQNGRVLLRMGGLIDKAEADKYAQALNLPD